MNVALPPWLEPALDGALQRLRGHATLVHGLSGSGQLEFALSLAGAWLCESPAASGRACGACAGCRLMASRTHPDFCLLVPEALAEAMGWSGGEEAPRDAERKKAKPSRELKVEAVREAIGWTHKTASRGRGKVLVAHPAEAMNPVAANALLKTLEEPPAGVRLVLSTADADALLPTIRSRCQRWTLALPTAEESLRWLQQQGIADPQVLLDAAGGRPLDALALAADGVDATVWQALPAAVARGDAQPLAGWPVPRAVDALHKLCHDAMRQAAGGAPRYFPARALPPGAQLEALVVWSKSLNRTARHDTHPWNANLLIESLVVEGARAWVASHPPAATKRLTTLGSR